jgi:hypothetical protein
LDQGSVVEHPEQYLKNIPKIEDIPIHDWQNIRTLWKRCMENENKNETISTIYFPIGNIP